MKKEEKNNYTNKENTNGAFVGIDEKYIPKNDSTNEKNTYVNENKGTKNAAKAYLIGIAIFFVIIFVLFIVTFVSIFVMGGHMVKSAEQKTQEVQNIVETKIDKATNHIDKEKTTKIIGVKEIEEDIAGKYTSKFEVSFQDGKLTTIKVTFDDIKDEYILNTLKSKFENSDIADKIVIGDKSFSYELTADEYAKYLKKPEAIDLLTRNYIYSNLKKNGYTLTVEGDDSFLGDNSQTSENTEQSTSESSNSNTKKSNTSSSDIDVGNMTKEVEEDIKKMKNGTEEDAEEIRQKYENKAREELNKRGYDYDQMINDAQKRAENLRQQYGY